MIAIATNILVRYVLDHDDPKHILAVDLIDGRCSPEKPAFVTHVVLAEFAWVARRVYKLSRADTASALAAIIDNSGLVVEEPRIVEIALRAFAQGSADFAEYLIAAVADARGARPTYTFDEKAGRELGFMIMS